MHPERSSPALAASPTNSAPSAWSLNAGGRGTDGFRGFYREHYGFVWQVVGRFGVAPAEHGDAVQDTFLTAYRKLGRMQGGAPRSWLYGIARRVASNYRRSARRAATRRADVAHAGIDVHTPALAEALGVLDGFLRKQSARDRELFVLSEVVGMSGQEIAEATGQAPRVIYARLRLLRQSVASLAPDALLPALGHVRAASPAATDRGWIALAPLLDGVAPAAVTPALAGLLKVAAALAIVGGSGVAVIAAASPEGSPRTATIAAATPSRSGDAAAEIGDPIGIAEPPATGPSPGPSSAPVPSARAKPRHDPPSTLAADNALLQRILAALQREDPRRAESLCREHARRFPTSPQADVRVALQLDALCRLGRVDEAARVAAPAGESPIVRGALRDCESAAKKLRAPDTGGSR